MSSTYSSSTGRIVRRAGAGLAVTGLLLALQGIPAVAQSGAVHAAGRSRPAPAAVSGRVRHWGTFFGGASALEPEDMTTSPARVRLPGRVVGKVATSNSSQYALLTDGSVYAWGLGNAGQLGDGATGTPSPSRCVAFPGGVKIASLPVDVMPYDTGLAVDAEGHARRSSWA